MRTMLNVVAVFVVGGALLFPAQSAQACLLCHRKSCSACASKKSSKAYGYSNYGYGYGYGYGYSNNNSNSGYPNTYWYCYPSGSANSAERKVKPPEKTSAESDTTTESTLKEKVAELDASVKRLQTDLNRYKGEVKELIRQGNEDTKASVSKTVSEEIARAFAAQATKKP